MTLKAPALGVNQMGSVSVNLPNSLVGRLSSDWATDNREAKTLSSECLTTAREGLRVLTDVQSRTTPVSHTCD